MTRPTVAFLADATRCSGKRGRATPFDCSRAVHRVDASDRRWRDSPSGQFWRCTHRCASCSWRRYRRPPQAAAPRLHHDRPDRPKTLAERPYLASPSRGILTRTRAVVAFFAVVHIGSPAVGLDSRPESAIQSPGARTGCTGTSRCMARWDGTFTTAELAFFPIPMLIRGRPAWANPTPAPENRRRGRALWIGVPSAGGFFWRCPISRASDAISSA